MKIIRVGIKDFTGKPFRYQNSIGIKGRGICELLSTIFAGFFLSGCAATSVVMHSGPRLEVNQRVVVKNFSTFMGDSVYLTKIDDSKVPPNTASVELSPGPHVLWTKFYRPPGFLGYVYKYSKGECWTKFIASPGASYRVNAFIGNNYWDPYLEELETGEIINLGFCGNEVRILMAPRPRVLYHGRKIAKKLIVYVSGNMDELGAFFRAGAYNAFRTIFSSVEMSFSPSSPMPGSIVLAVHINDKGGEHRNEVWAVPFSWALSHKGKGLVAGEDVVKSKESGDVFTDIALSIEGIFEKIGRPVSQWATDVSKSDLQ